MRASQIRTYPLPLGKGGLWFTVQEAARAFKVTPRAIQLWVAAGHVRSEEKPEGMGKGVLVWSSDVSPLAHAANVRKRKGDVT